MLHQVYQEEFLCPVHRAYPCVYAVLRTDYFPIEHYLILLVFKQRMNVFTARYELNI